MDVDFSAYDWETPMLSYDNIMGKKKEEIFVMKDVEYQPTSKIIQLINRDSAVIIAQEPSTIIRLDLLDSFDLESISIAKGGDKIYKIFLDPSGYHLIICLESEDNYYLHKDSPRPRALNRLRGIKIESIAWVTSDSSTASLLFGSSKGMIYETSIEAETRFFQRERLKMVFTLSISLPVSGLLTETFPDNPDKYYVLASTSSRIYEFIGGPTFEAMFSQYATSISAYRELPGSLDTSQLFFYSRLGGTARSFAWSTMAGIFYGDLSFGSQSTGDNLYRDTDILQYSSSTLAQSIALTEFHFLILFQDKLQIISRITYEIVFEHVFYDVIQHHQNMVGISLDPKTGNIFCYSSGRVFEVAINEEKKNVWSMYLDIENYEKALQYATKEEQKDKIRIKQAEHYFNQGSYDLSARCYGVSSKSFEEVALSFIQVQELDSLRTYLLEKLQNLNPNRDHTQITIICTWLTEMYLNKLNELEANFKDLEVLKQDFLGFLEEYERHLNHNTTFNLMSSHGRMDELFYYANLIGDYEKLITHRLQHGQYIEALSVLRTQTDPSLFYKHCPILMANCPVQTVRVLKENKDLDPRLLIPSLMRYKPEMDASVAENQAIDYLQYCVNICENNDPAIHNYLLSLYAAEGDEFPLINFLKQKNIQIDLEYALRLCTEYQKIKSSVLIYSKMGLYEEAVDLALQFDIDLAMEKADMPNDIELRKSLWLRIARHVVEEKKDIKKAMDFLQRCKLLKIEDILPFFPDFVLIDNFKKQICDSLEEYNIHIEELKLEMEDATQSAEIIRDDIMQLKKKYGTIDAKQTCAICGLPVLTQSFYLFPCQHVFHIRCLSEEMKEYVSTDDLTSILRLENEINQHGRSNYTGDEEYDVLSRSKEALDKLIASECYLCGEIMIDSISKPFFSEFDRDTSWEI
eukprot:TRINITY_DN5188_c1_g1_i2.p1 TRINITY_DN5188_c1_g1~~TRINITY_DN5188_c1_g1_i2.p1  ORF type:complete len:926 (+),score=184.08 TRINITY_DN5188_c1_g1_i2:22-2778(+)